MAVSAIGTIGARADGSGEQTSGGDADVLAWAVREGRIRMRPFG